MGLAKHSVRILILQVHVKMKYHLHTSCQHVTYAIIKNCVFSP